MINSTSMNIFQYCAIKQQCSYMLLVDSRNTWSEKEAIISSFILSNFNYCPLVWHFSSCESIRKIEKIQKRCLRIILNDYKATMKSYFAIATSQPWKYED